jgi:signal transduction histidine kinase
VELWRRLLSADYLPHEHCYLGDRGLIALHVVSDAGIALAYYAIPLGLLLYVRRRRRLAFSWLYVLFGAFIFACGTTHVMSIVTLWHPVYRLEGAIKAVTAVVSLLTAALLWPAVRRALAMRSPEELALANEQLEREVAQRRATQESHDTLLAELEQRVDARTEELRRSNEQLEMLAYVASHDLQEPLRMVASYTQLLQVMYKGKLDEEADQYIDRAVDGTMRMQALIDAFLAYARVDTRPGGFKFTSSEQALKLAELNLSLSLAETGAQVTADPLPMVYADLVQLVQVFQNLLSNAIKYRGERDIRIHVSARREGAEWVFSVKDDGAGIDPKHADRIFVMFRRLHGSSHPGTGMGLAICKRIIERHGGRIWVESEPGHGATFFFSLPVKDAADAPPVPE